MEDRAKGLFRLYGIRVPEYYACRSEDEVRQAAWKINRKVAVKALVPAGGRGKIGAVRFASTGDEAASTMRYRISFLYVSLAISVAIIVITEKEIMYSDTGHDLLWARISMMVASGRDMPPAKTRSQLISE